MEPLIMSITSCNVICKSPDELSCCAAVLEDGFRHSNDVNLKHVDDVQSNSVCKTILLNHPFQQNYVADSHNLPFSHTDDMIQMPKHVHIFFLQLIHHKKRELKQHKYIFLLDIHMYDLKLFYPKEILIRQLSASNNS